MQTIADILGLKGKQVHGISPDARVYDALEKLAAYNIGALVVLDDKEALAGIFSERDYARKVELQGRSSKDVRIREVMTVRVCTAEPQLSIEEAMAMMTQIKCRHLPVLEGGVLVGMISIGDVVKALIGMKEFQIAQLERYIAGSL
jgi:CBS domain-containing protein